MEKKEEKPSQENNANCKCEKIYGFRHFNKNKYNLFTIAYI